jgi:hypothetical protein
VIDPELVIRRLKIPSTFSLRTFFSLRRFFALQESGSVKVFGCRPCTNGSTSAGGRRTKTSKGGNRDGGTSDPAARAPHLLLPLTNLAILSTACASMPK